LQHESPIKSVAWIKEKGVLMSGSWDKTIKYWDLRSPNAQLTLPLNAQVISMDVKFPLAIVATSDKKIHLFDLNNPSTPFRSMDSPMLKLQVRVVKAFHNRQNFAVGGAEGRTAVRFVDANLDNMKEPGAGDKNKHSFAFKCHREGALIYSVNTIDTHPVAEAHAAFATGGGDGAVCFWDKDNKKRLQQFKPPARQQQGLLNTSATATNAITAGAWNPNGDLYAYASGNDWSKGIEGANSSVQTPGLFVHHWSVQQLVAERSKK
jgi:mRNA export factor